ncbi:MAG: hypothetical protein J1E64_09830 [Acetatifactor sp.]|nr:hypothetical protein [Acetatifactor sp.]
MNHYDTVFCVGKLLLLDKHSKNYDHGDVVTIRKEQRKAKQPSCKDCLIDKAEIKKKVIGRHYAIY